MWNFADFMSSCVLLREKKRKFDNPHNTKKSREFFFLLFFY